MGKRTDSPVRVIFHIDIDAFYASVEQKDNLSLKGKPVIVGALPGRRGVVSACSYEARKFGIHSAMPISQAFRRCPHGVFLPVRMSRYIHISNRIMSELAKYTPSFHQISVDEAFLDLTGTERLFGSPVELAANIKKDIKKKEGLTISIGIAPNYYLAKLSSEAGKPDGLVDVQKGEELAFLDTLELKELWGLGKKTLTRLHELNITTVRRLRAFSLNTLIPMLGEGGGRFLHNAVRGVDPGIEPSNSKNHSMSHEITFQKDKKDLLSLKRVMLELAQQVMGRLVRSGSKSKTAFIKLRYHDFTTISSRKTLKHWFTSSREIYNVVLELFKKKWDGHTPIRLIGLGVADVVKDDFPDQLELFQTPDDKRKEVEKTIIKINKKLTGVEVTRASLLKNKITKNRLSETQ